MAADRGAGRVTSTVRFRITALATVAVAAVLVVTAVGLVVVQRRALTSSLDETLAAEADAIAARIDEGGDPAAVRLDEPTIDDDAVAQVVVDGDVVATTDSDVSQPLAATPGGSSGTSTAGSVPDDDGAFRVASQRVGDGGGGGGTDRGARRGPARRRRREHRPAGPVAGAGGPRGDGAVRRTGVGAGGTHAPAGRGDPPRGGADRRHRPPAARAGARPATTRWRAWPAR